MTDIKKECFNYKDQFRDKVIYCNCDDARQSNFFKYFAMNFEFFGLKKLITTSFNANGHGTMLVYDGDKNGNRRADNEEIVVTELKGNGDFRSEECIELLKQADIVVTNPPFSLFREYVEQLMEHGKKFLVIGNYNAVTFKEIFPLIKDDKMWLGMQFVKEFIQPNGVAKKFGNICWFTNLPNKKRNQPMDFYKKYKGHEDEYPKYENYNAIECGKTCDIPEDYDGVIGVPITFLDKYCPEQFEIVGMAAGNSAVNEFGKDANYKRHTNDRGGCGIIKGERVYARILIRFRR